MPTSPPYTDEASLKGLTQAEREARIAAYRKYFEENQCHVPMNMESWKALGSYFLKLSIEGSHGKKQTREQFEEATRGLLKQPVPTFIKRVEYVQTDHVEGTYYLALPPKEFAKQALLHAKNLAMLPGNADDRTEYVKPPIYLDFTEAAKRDPEGLLCTRICDYVISHCG
jgi:hypothetical protein